MYLHIGGDDPFCYTEVRYNTWWLASADRDSHCLQEMQKYSCILIDYEDVKDDIEFAQMKRVVRCLGLKHTKYDIKRQAAGWRRIWHGNYTIGRRSGMPHFNGMPVLTFVRDGRRVPFNAFAVEYGLVYNADIDRFLGLMKLNGERMDVPFQYFGIHGGVSSYQEQERRIEEKVYNVAADDCNELIAVEECRGVYCPTGAQVVGYWGKGGIPCGRPPTPLYELIYGHEGIVVDDSTASWWITITRGLFGEITHLLGSVIRGYLGNDWQSKILLKVAIYYISFMLTKNNWLAATLTITIFVANFI